MPELFQDVDYWTIWLDFAKAMTAITLSLAGLFWFFGLLIDDRPES